jgi:hypothetical protein
VKRSPRRHAGEARNETIVVLLADSAERYVTTELFARPEN